MSETSKKKSFPEWLLDYVDGDANTWFEYFILGIIFINSISLGLESTPFGLRHEHVLFIIDHICLYIFIFELILKFIAYNKKFFRYKWNIFDLIIVLISSFATLPYFTVFRVFKVFRSVKSCRTRSCLPNRDSSRYAEDGQPSSSRMAQRHG